MPGINKTEILPRPAFQSARPCLHHKYRLIITNTDTQEIIMSLGVGRVPVEKPGIKVSAGVGVWWSLFV